MWNTAGLIVLPDVINIAFELSNSQFPHWDTSIRIFCKNEVCFGDFVSFSPPTPWCFVFGWAQRYVFIICSFIKAQLALKGHNWYFCSRYVFGKYVKYCNWFQRISLWSIIMYGTARTQMTTRLAMRFLPCRWHQNHYSHKWWMPQPIKNQRNMGKQPVKFKTG